MVVVFTERASGDLTGSRGLLADCVQQRVSALVLEGIGAESRTWPEGPQTAGGTASPQAGGPAVEDPSEGSSPSHSLSIHVLKYGSPCGARGWERRSSVTSEADRVGLELAQGLRYLARLERYGDARSSALDLGDWVFDQVVSGRGSRCDRARMRRVLSRLARCGDWLEFHRFTSRPDLPVVLAGGYFCQQWKLCRLCAIRRSVRTLRVVVPKVLAAIAAGRRPWFVTLTCRNGADLVERYEVLDRAFRRLVAGAGEARRRRGRAAWSGVLGGFASYEFKRGEGTRGGLWHPHVHAVVLSDGELDDLAVRRGWVEAVGDAVIEAQDVRPLVRVSSLLSDGVLEGELLRDAAAGDLQELCKYALKFTRLEAADQWRAAELMAGRRLVRSWGCVYGVEVVGSYLDDVLDVGDLAYLRLLVRFSRRTGKYRDVGCVQVDPSASAKK